MPDNDQRPDNLKKDTWIAVTAAILAAVILFFSDFGKSETVIYDCRDAHWHPDVPIEVKKQCREIIKERLEEIKKEEMLKKYITI